MPTLPAPIAARAERWFGRATTVTGVDRPSPGVLRVAFHTPDLAGRRWPPGQEIEFRVADREFRHYTAFAIDAAAGNFAVVFTRAADGPGTRWAWNLRPGDEVDVMGPGGGVRRGRRELFLGDATTLGLFAALLTDASDATGAIEVPAPDRDAAAALVPGLHVLVATEPGAALRGRLHEHLARRGPHPGRAAHRACLAGHAQTIQ